MSHTALKTLTSCVLVIFLFVAATCGGDKRRPPAADEAGELRIPLSVEPTAFDPQRANSTPNIGVVHQLFRGLFWYDEELKLIPMAAKEIPTQKNGGISRNKLVYRFRVRDGLRWSDGQPLTALDFEYAAKRLFDPAVGAARAAGFYDIQGAERYNTCKACSEAELIRLRAEVGVKAEDTSTLVITLKNPRATLLHLMTDPAFYPVPRDIVERYGDRWTEPPNFVGNGPFVLKERIPNDRLVLVPNTNWWGIPSRVKRVVFKIIPGSLDGFNAYLAGDIDLVVIPPEQKPTVDLDPMLVKQNMQLPLLQTLGYFFNSGMPPFDNPKVRQAFALALDRDLFVANVLQGVGRPAYSWLPPASSGHSKDLGHQWKFNPEKAKSVLAAAGYPNGNGLPPIVFPHRTTGLEKAYAEFLRSQLKQNLNVEIELRPMETRPWLDALFRKEHMIVFAPWTFAPDPESSISEVFGCQKYEGETCVQFPGNNIAQYSNPEVDRIMQQAAKEPNTSRRVNYYSKAEKIIVDDAPAAFMINTSRNLLVKPQVRDLVTTPLDGLFSGQYLLERAYIARE